MSELRTKMSAAGWRILALLAVLFLGASAMAQTPDQSTRTVVETFVKVAPSPNSRILMPSSPISYSPASTFMTHYVESDLSLSFIYNYMFTLSLKARDRSVVPVNVPDGWYALTMAVVAKEREGQEGTVAIENRFITSNPRTIFVPVVNGALTTKVTLKFRELAASAMLNDLYIELIPLRMKCSPKAPCIRLNTQGDPTQDSRFELLPGFAPFLAKMSFVPFFPRDNATPDVNELAGSNNPFGGKTLERWVWETRQAREFKRLQAKPSVQSPEQYARNNGLTYISVNDAALARASRNAFRGDPRGAAKMIEQILSRRSIGTVHLQETYRDLLPALCETLAAYNQEYQHYLQQSAAVAKDVGVGFSPGSSDSLFEALPYCAIQAETRFRLTRVTHVGQIDRTRKTQFLFNPQLSYGISTSAIKSRSYSWSATKWTSFKPFSFLFKLVDNVIDYSQSISVVSSRSELETSSATVTDTMDFDPMGLSIPTLGTRNCLRVTYLQQKRSPFFDARPGARNGFYICSDVKGPQDVQEIYAHVFTRNQDSSAVIAYAPGTQAINRSLRGDLELSGLFWSVRNALTANHNDRIFPSSFSQAAETYFASSAFNASHLVVAPVLFDREVEPSVIEMALGQYQEKFMENQPAPSN